ncbi:MAG: hypothetical protein OXD46_09515 [Chloroflexi bacterium]|nr:hypothetical protein [Chloroflexota bacterium]
MLRSTHGALRTTAARRPQPAPFVDSAELALILGVKGGAITSEDTKQLEATYARHTKH